MATLNSNLYHEITGSLSGNWQTLADEQRKTVDLETKIEALTTEKKQLEEAWQTRYRQLEANSVKRIKDLEEAVQAAKAEQDKLAGKYKASEADVATLRRELEGVRQERDELEEDFKGVARVFEKRVKK
jgi:chromosome segregation ATPase